MPRIEKLVPVDGRLGVVLDLPLDGFNGGPVAIYSDKEIEMLRESLKREAQEEIISRIVTRIGNNKCPQCIGWGCAKDIAATVRGEMEG